MLRAVVVLCALAAPAALADVNDFRIYQLGNPQAGGTGANPLADANFRSFVRQFGAAITSVNLAPPETLGHSGFAVNAELAVVSFQGGSLPTTGAYQGPLLMPSVHFRKGLPGSVEFGARAAWINQSRMGVGTLELKWAINEGFTYLPDIGVRGNISKLLNGRDFDLTTGGVDVGIGKQFAIGGMITLTPYVGWNLLFVGASSGNVDFNPNRSLADADSPGGQFKDIFVFAPVEAAANSHNRFYGGFRFIAGLFQLGAEVSYSLIGSFKDAKTGTKVDVPAVLVGSVTIGLDF
jgi:hypothetical protein